MVLMAPSQLIVRDGGQGGGVLGAVCALGREHRRGRSWRGRVAGARRSCAVLLLALGILQIVLLRYGFRSVQPQIEALGPFGQATWALTWIVLALCILMVVASFRRESSEAPSVAPPDGDLKRQPA